MKKRFSAKWLKMILLAVALLLLFGMLLVVSSPGDGPVEKVNTLVAGQAMELLADAETSKVNERTVSWNIVQILPSGYVDSDIPFGTTYTAGVGYCRCIACCASTACKVENGVLLTPTIATWNGKLTLRLTAQQWGVSSNDLIVTIKEKVKPTVTWTASPPATIYAGQDLQFSYRPSEPVLSCQFRVRMASGGDVVHWTNMGQTSTVTSTISGGVECYEQNYDVSYYMNPALPSGTDYYVDVKCTDYADNEGEPSAKGFRLESLCTKPSECTTQAGCEASGFSWDGSKCIGPCTPTNRCDCSTKDECESAGCVWGGWSSWPTGCYKNCGSSHCSSCDNAISCLYDPQNNDKCFWDIERTTPSCEVWN